MFTFHPPTYLHPPACTTFASSGMAAEPYHTITSVGSTTTSVGSTNTVPLVSACVTLHDGYDVLPTESEFVRIHSHTVHVCKQWQTMHTYHRNGIQTMHTYHRNGIQTMANLNCIKICIPLPSLALPFQFGSRQPTNPSSSQSLLWQLKNEDGYSSGHQNQKTMMLVVIVMVR